MSALSQWPQLRSVRQWFRISTANGRANQPKTDEAAEGRWGVPVAGGGAAVPTSIVPRAAAQHARSISRSRSLLYFLPAAQQPSDVGEQSGGMFILPEREQIQVFAQPERLPQLRQLHIGLLQAGGAFW